MASTPVFVDVSGGRGRRMRRLGWILCVVCLCSAVTVAGAVLGGEPVAPQLLLPEAEESKPPGPSQSATPRPPATPPVVEPTPVAAPPGSETGSAATGPAGSPADGVQASGVEGAGTEEPRATSAPGRRPAREPSARVVRHGQLRVNPVSGKAFVGSRLVRLSRTELDLLYLLASQPKAAIPRTRLQQRIQADTSPRQPLGVHISRLRKKLGSEKWIVSVPGAGFRIGRG
ncbi:winged helix-turn-helix domain-containing protein [Streptomyces wuyuanensis]|uniref:winged helix-turn-helix domain-containing protein n=1 Tax=Streptomyces wuyuanensis TaxID=1196353 RepID=UPI0036C621C8